MTKHLVMQALFRAVTSQRPPAGLVHHTDRGSQLRFKGSLQHLMFMTQVVDLLVLLLVISNQGFYAVCNSVRLRRHQVRAACTG
jgi:putative transposase